jgi:hypothetical protein
MLNHCFQSFVRSFLRTFIRSVEIHYQQGGTTFRTQLIQSTIRAEASTRTNTIMTNIIFHHSFVLLSKQMGRKFTIDMICDEEDETGLERACVPVHTAHAFHIM